MKYLNAEIDDQDKHNAYTIKTQAQENNKSR